jgi:hypothetical protein
MSDFMRDYNTGSFMMAVTMAKQPVYAASSACNYVVSAAKRLDLTEVDRSDIVALADELEVTAKALRSAARRTAKPVLMQAAE